ncbi:hypothetical protein QJS10_CPB17g00410 [Acorus calamus]|uniref:RRM domain-containing protein n=1 Tax=Acorus calamus TaxID=4465 RepID=A0AAV9CRU2_ACOCL|nr:hypothetical protein QJS10_CPB17g00410 [Acorus calamus]
MEDDVGDFDGGDHRISAAADEGFLGEEEDDDYDDLYNDVNVGEGFLQSLQRPNHPGFGGGGEREAPPPVEDQRAPPQPPPSSVTAERASIPGVGQGVPYVGVTAPAQPFPPMMPPSAAPAGGGGGGLRVELGQPSGPSVRYGENQGQFGHSNEGFARQGVQQQQQQQLPPPQPQPQPQPPQPQPQSTYNVNGGGGGGTTLFVGDLHWWTTDADLENELCKYGQVKEVKFFDEKASGKSKGYCQVDFFDPAAATACKEGMNGHLFNGRPCVVAFASPFNIRRMGEARLGKNQGLSSQGGSQVQQGNRVGGADAGRGGGGAIPTGGNYGRGAGGWGRGRGQMGGPMRNRVGAGGRGIMGNGSAGGGGFGGPGVPPVMPPQAMGFDPTYGAAAAAAHMGRMAGYGGFPGGGPGGPTFPGLMASFPPATAGGMGLAGVAPHVNPAFFGRGMGMMPAPGMDGSGMGMWTDPGMGGGWGGGDEGGGGGRAGESSYGEDAASDHQYGEPSHEKVGGGGGWSNAGRETPASERRYPRDDREKDVVMIGQRGGLTVMIEKGKGSGKGTGNGREIGIGNEIVNEREKGIGIGTGMKGTDMGIITIGTGSVRVIMMMSWIGGDHLVGDLEASQGY